MSINNNNKVNDLSISSSSLTNSNWWVNGTFITPSPHYTTPIHVLGGSGDTDINEIRLDVLKSILGRIHLEISSIENDIKDLSKEGDIKAFRIHKEGEKIGLLKIKKSVEDQISNLEDLTKEK